MSEPAKGLKGAFLTDRPLARRIGRKRLAARLVLLAEQALPSLVAALCVAALFLSVSWFGLFRLMPDVLRWIVSFGFVFAFLASLLALAKLRWPSAAVTDRFLEDRNGLRHQPVGVQQDEPAFDTPFARALWREHQSRMAAGIAGLDAGTPKPDIARHDRFALRTIPVLLVVTAAAFSSSNSAGTLTDAFKSHVAPLSDPDLRIDAWITPPSYTGKAPIYLTGNSVAGDKPVTVPGASDLTVRITGGDGSEKVLYTETETDETRELGVQDDEKAGAAPPGEAAAPAVAVARNHVLKLDDSGVLSVNGREWHLDIVADQAPDIAFDGIPRRSANGSLEIGFTTKDDYGVESAHAEIVPAVPDAAGAMPLFPLPDYKLDLPRRNARDTKGLASRNLTEHPLAGKRVRITLVAKDAAGQTGRSPAHEMILPARTFNEPLAASVAEERQVFALDIRNLPKAIALNEALAIRADETIPNLTHFLLLRSALARMKLIRDRESAEETAAHLWEVALGIEDGDLSLAERKLRDAQQALADALERNAPDAEIQKLMAELRKAMQEYLSAMAERMGKPQEGQQNQMAKNVLRQQDLDRMMDQIENLARSGNRDAAREMLSQMQRMMNNLQAGRPQQQQGQDNSKARQQIDKLGELLRDQQALMDETFKLDQALRDRMQRGDPNFGEDGEFLDQLPQPPNDPQAGDPEAGDEQAGDHGSPQDQMSEEQLREALKQLQGKQKELAEKLAEIGKGLKELGMKPMEGFGEAGREMQGAGEALGKGEGEPAVQGQGRALQALRKGAGEMMNQMMQAQQGQGQGQGQGEGQGQAQSGQNGTDPLGRMRRADGPDFGNDVKVPDEIDIQRAREILDAIRRKLGGNPGADVERHYLERLLDMQ